MFTENMNIHEAVWPVVWPTQYARALCKWWHEQWTAVQSFQLGGHNTLIVYWTLTSLSNTQAVWLQTLPPPTSVSPFDL